MNKNIAIKVQNLTKTYKLYAKPIDRLKESLHPLKKKYHKDFYALNDVSFEIKKGETVGIIGKNGSGKSTLLKIITGVLTPTSGRVVVHGKISAILELGVGFNPEMTGIENIYLNTSINGMSKQETNKIIDEIVAFAELGEHIHQPTKTYSSGMKARLAFSVSINVKPEILIVDEALAVGDMNFQAKCMTAMENIRNSGATVLFVSHSIDSIKSLCQRAIYLKNGHMMACGEAKDISELYIKEMREVAQGEYKKNTKIATITLPKDKENKINTESGKERSFITSEDFDKRVAQFRYGSGGAKVTFAELVNENNEPIVEADFNQKVKLRIYLESEINDNLSVNYYVKDSRKNLILGGGQQTFGYELIEVENGCKYVVEYDTRLPLGEGLHTIEIQLTKPLIVNKTAEFIDMIDDAVIFKVNQKKDCKIWTKAYAHAKYKGTKLC